MKLTAIRTVALALSFVLAAITGTAADEPKPVDFGRLDAALFARFDDGDDVLTAVEIGDYPWARLDADRDGRVTKQEFLIGRINERVALNLERDSEKAWQWLDWTSDGQLSGRELDEGIWLGFDRNGDGTVEKAEFLASRVAAESDPFLSTPMAPTATPVVPAPSTNPAAPADGWVTVRERGFEFRMPVGATREDVNGVAVFNVNNAEGYQLYHVTIEKTDDPEAEKNSVNVFDALRDYLVNTLACKIIEEKKIEVSGRPGRDITLSSATESIIRQRVVLVGSQMIEMNVPIRDQSAAEIDRFFTSLQVVDPTDAAPPARDVTPSRAGDVPPAPRPDDAAPPPPRSNPFASPVPPSEAFSPPAPPAPALSPIADGWKLFRAMGYEFLMPAEATEVKVEQGAEFRYTFPDAHTSYIVVIRDLGKPAEQTAEAQFKNIRDQYVAAISGNVTLDKEIDLAGKPGREIKIETPRGVVVRVRAYVVGSHLVRHFVSYDRFSRATPEEIERFFASFKRVEPPPGR
jgi:hypothetical protein